MVTAGSGVGQPFMVTELMGRGDVEGVIEDATDHRLSLEQAIRILTPQAIGHDARHGRGQ